MLNYLKQWVFKAEFMKMNSLLADLQNTIDRLGQLADDADHGRDVIMRLGRDHAQFIVNNYRHQNKIAFMATADYAATLAKALGAYDGKILREAKSAAFEFAKRFVKSGGTYCTHGRVFKGGDAIEEHMK